MHRRIHALGSSQGRPDLSAYLGSVQHNQVERIVEVLERARAKGWIRPDADLPATVIWTMGSVFGRILNAVDPEPIKTDRLARLTLQGLRVEFFGAP